MDPEKDLREVIVKELKKRPLSRCDILRIAKQMRIDNSFLVLEELFKSKTISSFLDENTNPATVMYYLL